MSNKNNFHPRQKGIRNPYAALAAARKGGGIMKDKRSKRLNNPNRNVWSES